MKILTLAVLLLVAFVRPAHADGSWQGPIDEFFDKWGFGGYPDSDTSVQVRVNDGTPAAQNIQQAIDFLRDMGDTQMADDLAHWFSDGWTNNSKIYRDPDPGGNADTNMVGTITLSDGIVGANQVFDPVKDFDKIVSLARTLTHEMTHVEQFVLRKLWNSIENKKINAVQDHEVEGWEVALDALRRWHDALWLRYFDEKDPAKKLALAQQLKTLADVEAETWGNYAENKFYGADPKQYKEQRAQAEENVKYGNTRVRVATQELKRVQEAQAQARIAAENYKRYQESMQRMADERQRAEAAQKAAQLKADAEAKQEAYRQAVAAQRRAEQEERDRAQAQLLRQDANRLDGPAATSERQSDEWEELERAARESARRNRERARNWRREGREDWAKDWEDEARRDDEEAARRAREAERLKDEAKKLRDRARQLREQAAQLSPQQISQLLPQVHQEVQTLLAAVPRTPRVNELTVLLRGENRSAGEIFTCTFTNHSDQTLLASVPAGLVLVPRHSAYQKMIIGQSAALALLPGQSATIKLDGFCLDPGKLPPPINMPALARQSKTRFVLIAGENSNPNSKPTPKTRRPAWLTEESKLNLGLVSGPAHKETAPYVAIVRAGNELDTQGKLAIGIQDPKTYRTTVIQRAIWFHATKGTPRELGKAALQKEIAEQSAKVPADKRPSPQMQVQSAERIWADVQKVLQHARL
jgi:hypothetical protein